MIGKILVGTLLVGGALLLQDGIVTVNVRQKQPRGHHIWFAAPGALAAWGLRLAPARELRSSLRDSKEWLPVAQAAIVALEKSPDAVFVQVDGPTEHVRVEKSWGRVVVDVDDANEEVHVAVPVRVVRHVLRELEEIKPPA